MSDMIKKFIKSITENGLYRCKRKHIHFVQEIDTSKQLSGFRQNSTHIIKVDMEKCMKDGILFYKSENNVILFVIYNCGSINIK